jgi:hypothetical protein
LAEVVELGGEMGELGAFGGCGGHKNNRKPFVCWTVSCAE